MHREIFYRLEQTRPRVDKCGFFPDLGFYVRTPSFSCVPKNEYPSSFFSFPSTLSTFSSKVGEICFRFDVGRAGHEAQHRSNEVRSSTATIDSDMELKNVSFRLFHSLHCISRHPEISPFQTDKMSITKRISLFDTLVNDKGQATAECAEDNQWCSRVKQGCSIYLHFGIPVKTKKGVLSVRSTLLNTTLIYMLKHLLLKAQIQKRQKKGYLHY